MTVKTCLPAVELAGRTGEEVELEDLDGFWLGECKEAVWLVATGWACPNFPCWMHPQSRSNTSPRLVAPRKRVPVKSEILLCQEPLVGVQSDWKAAGAFMERPGLGLFYID